MKAIPLALAILLCAAPATAQEWKEMKSAEGNFRVSFPGEPQYLPQDVPLDDGSTLKMHVFYVETEDGAVSYMAFYNDYAEDHVRNTGADTILKNCQQGAVNQISGKVAKESAIALGKHPGREFRFSGESDGMKAHAVWQLYLVKNRLYQVGVVAIEREPSDELVRKFQKSFALLREVE